MILRLIVVLIFLVSGSIFGQEKIATFKLLDSRDNVINYVNGQNKSALLCAKTKGNEYYWIKFDKDFKNINSEPFKIEDEAIEASLKDYKAFLYFHESNNQNIPVSIYSYGKKNLTYSTGILDLNNLEEGITSVNKVGTIDLKGLGGMNRNLVHTKEGGVLIGKFKRDTYKLFILKKDLIESYDLKLADPKNTLNFKKAYLSTSIGYDENKFFSEPYKSIIVGDEIYIGAPSVKENSKIKYAAKDFSYYSIDLNKKAIFKRKIDFPRASALDYVMKEDGVYIAYATQEKVELLYKPWDSKTVQSIFDIKADDSEYTFSYKEHYFNKDKRKKEIVGYKDFIKETKKTLVLDIDKIDNNQSSITLTGVRYRDPNGFAKVLTSVVIGSMIGIGTGGAISAAPIFGASKLQPLVTQTNVTFNKELNKIEPQENQTTYDSHDRLVANFQLIQFKDLVGFLKEDIILVRDLTNNNMIVYSINL